MSEDKKVLDLRGRESSDILDQIHDLGIDTQRAIAMANVIWNYKVFKSWAKRNGVEILEDE